MITEEKLREVTQFMKDEVWRNQDIMYYQDQRIIDIATSLHNLLYEAVTGERYNYAFHWANKIGSDVSDNIFDMNFEEELK